MPPTRWPLSIVIRMLMYIGLAATAVAHRVDLSAAKGMLVGDTFTFAIQLPAVDAQRALSASARSLPIDAGHFAEVRPYLLAYAGQAWEVRTDATVAPPVSVDADLLPTNEVLFQLSFLRLGARKIALRSRHLATAPPGQRELVMIQGLGGNTRIEKMLTAGDDTLEFEVSPLGEVMEQARPETRDQRQQTSAAGAFLWLGVEHIWTGYDHLLFLFSLLIVCRRFRSIVSIVSCFTLAHSITLAVATLGWVRISPTITEPAIAATIVFVAGENLIRRGAEPKGRWAVTFVFGLIHGFGFATVLRDLGVGENGTSTAMPLFAFNVGVELGQIAIAAAVLPLLWHWRKNDTFVRVGVPVLSAIGAAAGLFWFLQRTVWG